MKTKVLPELRIPLLKRLLSDFNYKILYWDIETSPNEGYFFSTGDQVIRSNQIKEGHETKIITIQYMWEGDKDPKYIVWDETEDGFDDSRIVEFFIKNVLRSVSQSKLIVVGQNHKAFDHMILNERARDLRLTPPTHNMIKIDTYKTSRATFKKASHGLDYRSKQYKLGGKMQTEFSVWTDIMEHKAEPEDILVPYGLKDVVDLRTIFWNDLPYLDKLPSDLESLLLKAHAKCVKCEVGHRSKYNLEECKVNKKAGFMCLNCGEKFVNEVAE